MLARLTHLAASPIFIFGLLGLPAMGISGAAMANVIAQSLGVIWNVYALLAGTSRLRLTLRGFYPDFPLMWHLIRIGAPASGTQMERGLSELMLVRLVATTRTTTTSRRRIMPSAVLTRSLLASAVGLAIAASLTARINLAGSA